MSYKKSLLALLPDGSAWPRDDDSAIALLMLGLEEEFARIDARAQQLIDESLPSGVMELLERWEADYGLPDTCSAVVQTFDQRISSLEQKYKLYGSQSRIFLISLVEAYNVPCEITEYKESVFGGDFGGYFWGTDWAFVIQFDIEIPDTITDIDSTKSILECSIARILHAHKYPIFVYDNPAASVTYPLTLTLSNPGAEDPIGGEWISTSGALQRISGPAGDGTVAHTGSYFFYAGTTLLTEAYQDVALIPDLYTDIDNDLLMMNYSYWQCCSGGDSQRIRVEFQDASNLILGSYTPQYASTGGANDWRLINHPAVAATGSLNLPPGTRIIRLINQMSRSAGTSNDGYSDDISASILLR